MIYFSADDYGLGKMVSGRIRECIDAGKLNKISIFPNFDTVDLSQIKEDVLISLHLNLVEGRCMAPVDEVRLLADGSGNFKNAFGGLLKLSLFKRRDFEKQVKKEIRAQVRFWKNLIGDRPFLVDVHQHTHMIPSVFRALSEVLKEEQIKVEYIRIPAEPLLPYIKTPSLYLTYSGVNVIKQWLLRFLWLFNKKYMGDIPTALFMGILFSGRMDERVEKVLPKYIKMAEKDGRDVEVLFHPGYTEKNDLKNENIVFEKFYLSDGRRIEYKELNGLK